MPQKTKYILFIVLILCLGFISTSQAEPDITVSLKADRTEATMADSIRLIVSVSGSRSTGEYPSINGLDPFSVSRGGTSSRIQIVNGKVDAGVDYTYFLQPQQVGTFSIGPAEVRIKGKSFQSNTITLTIEKLDQAGAGDRGPLFLTADLSRKEIFPEEQTVYTLKLFRRVNIRNPSLSLPETDNLKFTRLGETKEYQSILQGKTYQVLEVQYVIIASKEGDYLLSPARMNMTVLENRRQSPRSFFDDSFFNDPFFSSGRPRAVTSEALELKVLPLPLQKRPADFSGLVGRYQLESSLEPKEVKAGESATLTVELKGRGNIKHIPDMKLTEIEGTKIYADQPVLKESVDGQGLVGLKTMKWAIVPEKAGEFKVPILSVSYFDTMEKRYKTIKTAPHTLTALPGEKEKISIARAPSSGQEPEGPAKHEVKEVGHDILPIHSSMSNLSRGYANTKDNLLIWSILLMPVVIYGATFFGLRTRRKAMANIAALKSKKAFRQFSRRGSRNGISAAELIDALREYLNDRLNLSLGLLTPSEAYEILTSNGVSNEKAQRMQEMIKSLEDSIYTGRGQDECRFVEDARQLIRQIDREIK